MWIDLPKEQKQEYKKMILAFASLTEMFAQKEDNEDDNSTISPFVNSKYQETVFQRVFHASAEDIGNTSYDAALKITHNDGTVIKYLIGIKTFGIASGAQKVAQFKSNQKDWIDLLDQMRCNAVDEEGIARSKEEINHINQKLYLSLANSIADLRNLRIESSASNIQGFSVFDNEGSVETVYHVLMPSQKGDVPSVSVGETSYDKIQTDHIEILGCTSQKNPTNFSFTDGRHKYRFTAADSQLLMDFNNHSIVKDVWPVTYAEDAYAIFAEIADRVREQSTNAIIESYCWKIEVQQFSGFNSFYGVGSKLATDGRKQKIQSIVNKFKDRLPRKLMSLVHAKLTEYLLNEKDSNQKCQIRQQLLAEAEKYSELFEDLKKILYRPKEEIYIPLHNSKKFHKEHPDFFGKGIGNLSFSKGDRDNSIFTMVLEPSGEEFECFVTQENGKAIESVGKQSILGEWLLRKVFLLKEYEPLTQKRLNDLGINGIRFYKTKDKKVHMEFIWIDEEKLPQDFLE